MTKKGPDMSTDVCDHEWREICSKCKAERGINQLGIQIMEKRIAALQKEADRLRKAIEGHLACENEELPPCEVCSECEERFRAALERK